MKNCIVLLVLVFVYSCKNSTEKTSPAFSQEAEESPAYFPVTNYLRGQIAAIKKMGVNPLKIVKQGGMDSSWVRIESLDSTLGIFLTPEIDSVNMVGYFRESKFHDKTINSYTFTYEPKTALPDSFLLQRWDVYVDPQSGNVRKIYIEKSAPDSRFVQLSWEEKYGCKIVWFKTDTQGKDQLEKEETIKWNFEEEQ